MQITDNENDVKPKPKVDLTIEMMVEVTFHGKPYYGVVKWLGPVEVEGKMENLVGLEMVCTLLF